MACGTFTEAGVPKNDLEHRKALWTASGATKVTSVEDPDHTFTITAVFPPCPDNVSHDKGNTGSGN